MRERKILQSSSQFSARYLVTSALIYANGPVHIGHLAGCYLPADIYVRYLRARARDVCFVSGTDEHGVAVTLQAHKEKLTPQQLVDHYYLHIKKTLQNFGISFDIFDRTTQSTHYETAQEFFLKMYEKECFEERTSKQFYDEKMKIFLADRYIRGSCPSCKYEDAYGDQCEKCGRSLSPQELQSPSSVFGGKVSLRSTKNWYLPMQKWQDVLQEYIKKHKPVSESSHSKGWRRHVYQQCISWLEEGLRMRAMTRDLSWGVDVPLSKAEGKVLYVWFEAPIGYISATKKLHPKKWKEYWKKEDTKIVHFIGKDNIVFHCLIFPLMLKLHGEYVLAEEVPANEFLNLEGKKISTSRGWAVWLHEYLQDFPNQQDTLRYVLCAKMPENKDSNFSWKEFQERNNNELLSTLGNFVHRSLHLAQKYTKSQVPSTEKEEETADLDLSLGSYLGCIAEMLETFRFQEALRNLLEVASLGNRYLAKYAPWEKGTSEKKRRRVIHNVLQICATLAVVSEPFLPNTSKRLQYLLNFSQLDIDTAKIWDRFSSSKADKISTQSLSLSEEKQSNTLLDKVLYTQHILPSGHSVQRPVPLFRKIEDKEIDHQLQKLHTPMEESSNLATSSKEINIDAFAEVDIRIATVLRCEVVLGSEKLLRFTLDDGEKERVILSGIAAYYKPDALVGEQVVILKNLRSRKIMGEISEGMVLCAVAGKRLRLLRPDELIDAGAKVE